MMSFITRLIIGSFAGLITALILGALTLAFFQVGPVIQAKYFPIGSDFQLADVRLVDGKPEFRFRATKHWACPVVDVAWFRRDGIATSSAIVTRVETGPIPARPVGVNLTGWWRIEDEPQAASYLGVYRY